jgi:hypothetical protein
MPEPGQLVLYHKHPTSARLRFLRHAHGGVCAAAPLPDDAQIEAGAGGCGSEKAAVSTHPGMLLRAAESALGLSRGCIEPDGGFRCHILADGCCAQVHLARFCDIDPPLDAALAVGADFIDLTAARRLPAVELRLLRLAYEHVLG